MIKSYYLSEFWKQKNGLNPFLGIFFIFLIIGILLYINTFKTPFFFDDYHVIANISSEEAIIKCKNPQRVVAHISFALNLGLLGKDVTSYHILNTLIHIGTAYAVFHFLYLLLQINRSTSTNNSQSSIINCAALGAALFLAHPLATQSVTYICQRYTSLATLFYMLGILSFIQARRLYGQEHKFGSLAHVIWYLSSILFASLSMFTKEFPVTFPLIALLTELIFFSKDSLKSRSRFFYLCPLLLTGLIIPILYSPNLLSFFSSADTTKYVVKKSILPDWAPQIVSRSSYLLTQIEIIWKVYLKLMLLPWGQSFDHEYSIRNSLFEKNVFVPFVCLISVCLVGCFSIRRFRLISYGIFWFFITIAPTSSIIPNKQFVAEHRTYLPMICLSFVVAEFFQKLSPRKSLLFGILLLLAPLSFLTVNRNFVWGNDFSIWSDAAKKGPARDRPHLALGDIYFREEKYALAENEYKKFLELNQQYSPGFVRLGRVLANQGYLQEAVQNYHKAAYVNSEDPGIYSNLVEAYKKLEQYDLAIRSQKKLMSLNGEEHVQNQYNLAKLLELAGRIEESQIEFAKCIVRDSNFIQPYLALGLIFKKLGKYNLAEEIYKDALKISNSIEKAIIRTNLGNLYEEIGKNENAISQYQRALKVMPKSSKLHFELAKAYLNMRNYSEAIYYSNKAEALGMVIGDEFLEKLQEFR